MRKDASYADGYAAGLEAAAEYLDELAAVAAVDPAQTGAIWPKEAANSIRKLGLLTPSTPEDAGT